MAGKTWNLIVIDNGSTDDTYEYIESFRTGASNYLHISVGRIYNKDKFRQVCFSYAEEYLQNNELLKVVKNPNVHFEGNTLSSFCFMATENIAKEALLLVYSIRCFHREPIYVICDYETKDYIKERIECYNIFFECSADQDNLNKIASQHNDKFNEIGTQQHKLECIYHKMRAIEFALENESNTLFTDSDIIITSKFKNS